MNTVKQNTLNTRALRRLGATWALVLALPLAAAADRGTSPEGVAFASGGATDSELDTLRAERRQYSYWLTTASKGSGAYLAMVQVRITDSRSGRVVLEHTMDGPWLYAALPAGRYTVEATAPKGRGGRPETQRTSATIGKGQLRQTVLYFDTGDLTEADVVSGQAPLVGR